MAETPELNYMGLYSVYHCNLMFSSIEVEKRAEVIQKCYWPLLNLAENGYKISLEASAITLEYILELDKCWIEELKKLIVEEKIEFIGSGYSQIIAPIVPHEINSKNLRIGQEVYQKILGMNPRIFLVNEMAFSADLISLYKSIGIESIILEWNNFYKFTSDVTREHSFGPVKLKDKKNNSLNVFWADTIFFQKFQRYVHGELDRSSYLDFINSRVKEKKDQYIPVYTSDAEIFDFRPGRYKTENSLSVNEWEAIAKLYADLKKISPFVFLTDILKECVHGLPELYFSSLIPIQVKKQDKYNIFRWAVGGRNNLKVNSSCYKILAHCLANKITDDLSWKELLFYWSSDFRTHITQSRYQDFESRIAKTLDSIRSDGSQKENAIKAGGKMVVQVKENTIEISTGHFDLKINRNKGLSIESFQRKSDKKNAIIGRIEHGTYDDISYSNDYFSGHAICYDNERKQYTHLFKRNETIKELENCIVITANNSCNDKFIIEDVITVFDQYVELHRIIKVLDLSLNIVHPFIFTFLPDDRLRNFHYQTTCGGDKLHDYCLSQSAVQIQQTKHLTITALNGFSPTSGILSVITGNDEGHIRFEIDNTASPLVASFQYEDEVGIGKEKMPFCRLVFSAQEINDAYKGNTDRSKNIESRIRIY